MRRSDQDEHPLGGVKIDVCWTVGDIMVEAEDMEAGFDRGGYLAVKKNPEDNFNGDEGITWQVIRNAIRRRMRKNRDGGEASSSED